MRSSMDHLVQQRWRKESIIKSSSLHRASHGSNITQILKKAFLVLLALLLNVSFLYYNLHDTMPYSIRHIMTFMYVRTIIAFLVDPVNDGLIFPITKLNHESVITQVLIHSYNKRFL